MTPPARAIASTSIAAPVASLLQTLRARGFEALLVGGCVRDLLEGRPVHDFDVASSASPEAVLEAFEHAVPIGLRHGTVMVPTSAGPVDVTRFRAGPRIEDDLAHRDFTLNAIAFDPVADRVIDPHDGLGDLAAGRLRAVGSADDRFREDPLRALRAARFVSERGFDAVEVETAMARVAPRIASLAGERIRAEIERMLLGANAGDALALLRRTGIEPLLAPGTRSSAPDLVDALPRRRAERLAGWLLGTHPLPVLARLRFPRRLSDQVDRLVRLHPIDAQANPASGVSQRRLIRKAGKENLDVLFSLARAEISLATAPGDSVRSEQLAALERSLDQALRSETLALHRGDLAVSGAEVMAALDCPPGPEVGRALRYLTEHVLEDPSLNTRGQLLALLERRNTQ